MTERRAWGTGSVTFEFGAWRPRLPREYGRKRLEACGTEEEGWRLLDAALVDLAADPPQGLRLAEWGERWLTEREESGHYRAVKRERDRWRAYVAEAPIGKLTIPEVDERDVRDWLKNLRGKRRPKLEAQTKQNALAVLRQSFEAAIVAELRADNPAANVTLPKGARAKTSPKWDWLRANEIAPMLSADVETSNRAILTLATYSGMRAGEIWALMDEAVDFGRGILHVRLSLAEDGTLGPTKSGEPREVPMLDPVRKSLKAWMGSDRRRSHLGLVFPARDGGPHSVGFDAQLPTALALGKVKRRIHFHDLRHTCASHLLQGTWSPRLVARALRLEEVRDWLGHSDIKVTQRYAHLCSDAIRGLVTGPVLAQRSGATSGNRTPDLRFTKPGAPLGSVEALQVEVARLGRALGQLRRLAIDGLRSLASRDQRHERHAAETYAAILDATEREEEEAADGVAS